MARVGKTLGDHPGFAAVAQHIAQASQMPIGEADAVLASKSRNASPAAKRANPRLNKVKGKKKSKSRGSGGVNYMFGK